MPATGSGADGLPQRIPGNVYEAAFICNMPRSATPEHPARPSLYGHGLFGDAGEVRADNVEQLGNENNVLVCGADWIGMSENDIPNAAGILTDLSRFPSLADRLQQGFLDFMFIGRAMIHPQGFAAHPAFQRRRAVSNRHSPPLLLRQQPGGDRGRSTDRARAGLQPLGALRGRDELQPAADAQRRLRRLLRGPLPDHIPDELARPLLLSMIQMLWDRGEPNGYAWHMTGDPLPNTPRHKVLQLLSFGDHQVANVATEVQARTIGSHVSPPRRGSRPPHRSARPTTGMPPIHRFPYWRGRGAGGLGHRAAASARLRRRAGAPECLGTPAPPITNTPPRIGVDPHDLVIESEAAVRRQIAEFLRDRRARDRRVRSRPLPRGGMGRAVERAAHRAAGS